MAVHKCNTMNKRVLLILFLLGFFGIGQVYSTFDDWFYTKTLRMDYHQTGNHLEGKIDLLRFVEEPHWGGSKVNLTDTFGYGRYYFEVRDAQTGILLYSRGFSTLFVEWQDTKEAKETERSFRESIVMPYPKLSVSIEIFTRDKQNTLHKLFITSFNPSLDRPFKPVPLPYPVFDVVINGPTETSLDFIFIAEGYTTSEMELFKQDCELFSGYLFGASPFREKRNRINIRGVFAVSEESGVTIPGDSLVLNTAVGASFYTFGSERYLMAEDFHRVRDVAGLAPYDQIFIIVNSDKYGGGGIFNFYATGTRGNRAADFLLIHEVGHSFAGLADEYYNTDDSFSDFYDLTTEPWEPNITTLIDFGSKWQDMVLPGTEIPTPVTEANKDTVGVYEGGGYVSKGIYRPYTDCTMRSVRYDAFCPVCIRAIARMIEFYSY